MISKVGYILQHFPAPSETFVINEIIAVQSLGIEVYTVLMFPAQPCQQELVAAVHREPYDLSQLDRHQLAQRSPFLLRSKQLVETHRLSPWFAEFAACVADFAIANNLEHLHAHFAADSALVAMLVSELTDIPFSFTAHAYDLFIDNPGEPGETQDLRLNTLVQRASQVIAISQFNKRFLLDKTKEEFAPKINVIHCGIDTERFIPQEVRQAASARFLSVGRFVEKKGHQFLVRAFEKVLGAAPQSRLCLVGDGPLKPEIMDLCGELGILDQVEFLGSVSSETVQEQVGRADVFVLHSVTAGNADMEGIPVSLMEASASGLPVISTWHAGIPELVIDGSTGFLNNERDIDGLASSMIRLATEPALRNEMGKAGRILVAKQFNQQVEATKLKMAFQTAASDYLVKKVRTLPFISVIVPVFNGETTLGMCLDSLEKLDYPKDNLEIIIVDNGSTDSSVSIANRYDVTVLHEPILKSSYAARNVGIRAAKGELIAFTDADCIVTPGWLKLLAAHWADDSIGCFAGEIEAYKPEDLIEKFSDRAGILRQNGTLSCPYLPYTQTANSAYRKTVFDQVGLFDPEMTSGGDADISWRMQKQLGLKIKFIPEALVYHKHRTSLEGLYSQFKKYEHGKLSWGKAFPDYPLPPVAERRATLVGCIEHLNRSIYPGINAFCKAEIDLTSFLTPVFQLLMALGTYRARLEEGQSHAELISKPETSAGATVTERVATLERDLADANEKINSLQSQLVSSNRRVEDLLSSLSWKITAPLRKLFDLFFSGK